MDDPYGDRVVLPLGPGPGRRRAVGALVATSIALLMLTVWLALQPLARIQPAVPAPLTDTALAHEQIRALEVYDPLLVSIVDVAEEARLRLVAETDAIDVDALTFMDVPAAEACLFRSRDPRTATCTFGDRGASGLEAMAFLRKRSNEVSAVHRALRIVQLEAIEAAGFAEAAALLEKSSERSAASYLDIELSTLDPLRTPKQQAALLAQIQAVHDARLAIAEATMPRNETYGLPALVFILLERLVLVLVGAGLTALVSVAAVRLWRRPRQSRIDILPNGVRVDGEWIPALDLLGFALRRRILTIERAAAPLQIGPLKLSDVEADGVLQRLRLVLPTAEQRAAEASARPVVEASVGRLRAAIDRERPGSG